MEIDESISLAAASDTEKLSSLKKVFSVCVSTVSETDSTGSGDWLLSVIGCCSSELVLSTFSISCDV